MNEFDIAKMKWEAATNAGTISERIARAEKLALYFQCVMERFESSVSGAEPPSNDHAGYGGTFADILIRELGLNHNSTVLDVGCGGGGASMRFAKICSRVLAIDMNGKLLTRTSERFSSRGVTNIEFREMFWEHFNTSEQFDLCFASMCSAICDYEQLLRFESKSRKSCAVVTIGRSAAGDKSGVRRKLRECLTPNPLPGLMVDGRLLFDLLCEMERKPNVVQKVQHSLSRVPIKEAIARFTRYYAAWGYDDEASEQKIRVHIEQNSIDGVWTEDDMNTLMLIYWDVPESV